MKPVVVFVVLLFATGCAHAHKPLHTHTPSAPDRVKVSCASLAEYPRKCVQRWKNEHSYSHRHAGGHGHRHTHGSVHAHAHGHAHGKPKVRLGVGVSVPLG